MIYAGTVRNGVVVPDDGLQPFPEGARVEIRSRGLIEEIEPSSGMPTMADYYRDVIGKSVGLPEDAAKQHDHYLYGTPKRP